jgi:hypothetical protein
MDAREELKRWIAMVVQLSSEEESKTIKQDIDLFLSVAGELSGKLADRNTALAKQCRSSSKSKPPKPAPQNGLVTVLCRSLISLCHLCFERQRADATQI